MKSTARLRAADFEVAVSPEHLDRSGAGGITGVLAVRIGDAWFPERTWSDFPVVVLAWWLRECASLATGGHGRFRFMDGPFQFNARNLGNGRAELEADHGGRSGAQVTAPVAHVRAAVLRAARQTIGGCVRRGWEDRDVEELRLLAESGHHAEVRDERA
jgi:hypothetical protein